MLMHPKFQAGQYRAVAEELLDGSAKERRRYIASLVAALSFLGRLEEALAIYELEVKQTKGLIDPVAARFFLAVGLTRRSEYARAKEFLDENKKKAGKQPLSQFFVHQGEVFFQYYTGHLSSSLEAAGLAQKAAILGEDLFARTLATDSLGHGQVRLGQINQGLATLAEAERLAKRIGNKSMAAAISISRDLYACEYGINTQPVARLEELWRLGGPENNYSQANVGLELARQLTLRGQFSKAHQILEKVAPLVYANQNRRHEIQLNLRLAELSGRRGAYFQARHFVWFSRRLLNLEVDGSIELQAIGIEAKITAAEGKTNEAAALNEKARSLGLRYPSARERNLRARREAGGEENPEDRVHSVLKAAALASSVEEKLKPLLQAGYFAEAALNLKLVPGIPALAVLPGRLGLLIQCPDEIEWREAPLSPLQRKLLALFRKAEVSKQMMVEGAWGYSYDSLRHDNMVYAALSALRRSLGRGGAWITPTENGYRLGAKLWMAAKTEAFAPSPTEPLELASEAGMNHRQVEILEWLKATRFCSVKECQERFGTSEITALRDLAGLCRLKLVVRIGKARATRYGAVLRRK